MDRMVTHILFDLCLFKHFSPVANFSDQSLKIQEQLQKGFGRIVRLRSKRPTNIFGRQFKMVLTLCVWYSGFLQTRQFSSTISSTYRVLAKGALPLHLSTVYFSYLSHIEDQIRKCIHITKPLIVISSCCR